MASVARAILLVFVAAVARAGMVDDLVAGLPAAATVSRDSVMPELVRMGPGVVAALAARLVEPGRGDDNAARWGLHGLAFYVSRPASGSEREWYCQAIEAELAKRTWSDFNRQFLEEQLRWVRGIEPAAKMKPPADAEIRKLEKVAVSATGFDRWEWTDELLAAGRRLAGTNRAGAAALFRRLLIGRPGEPHVRCAALEGLSDAVGAKACPDLLVALTSEEPDVADCAGRVAREAAGPGITGWWAARIADRQDAAPARAAILGVLAARGDAAALPSVRRSLRDPDPEVRRAALRADAALAGAGAVPDLAAALAGPDAAEARDCLLDLPADAAGAIERAVPSAAPRVRAGLVAVLGARGAPSSLPVALAAIADPDPAVRRSALGAVGVLGGPGHLALIVGTLAGDPDVREAAADAFALIVKRMKDSAPAAAAVLATLPGTHDGARAALLGLLAKPGGEAALAAVREGLADADRDIREAAVRALGEWPDASPLEDLGTLSCKAPEPVFRVLALRGFVRVAGKADEGDAVLVGRLRDAYGIAERPEDRTLVLGALGKVAHPAALELAMKAMDEPAVREEAAAAAGRIAGELVLTRREQARAALDRVLKVTTSDDVKEAAGHSLKAIEACEDYVTAWEVAGPFTREGLDDHKLLDTVFDPETKGANVTWRLLPRNEEQDDPYILDLMNAVGGEHRAGYLRTRVFVAKSTKAKLELGSDDAVKVWIGGKVVHSNDAWRGTKCGDDKVDVALAAGWNPVMVKVVNGEGDWSACVRFRTRDGDPVKDLRAEAGEAE